MPRSKDQRLSFQGPFLGRNDFLSPQQLALGQFAVALNMMNIAGRMVPRHGSVLARTPSFLYSPMTASVMAALPGNFGQGDHIRVDPVNGFMYFMFTGNVWRVLLTGSTPLQITTGSGLAGPFAINVAGNALYAYQTAGAKIVKYNSLVPAGAFSDLVTTGGIGPVSSMDYYNNKIWWTNGANKQIYSADTTALNSNVAILATPATDTNAIAVDGPANKIYVGSRTGKTIRRHDLNGTNGAVIVNDADAIDGLTLDIVAGKMYWASDIGGANAKIRYANLDGTNPANLTGKLTLFPYALAINPTTKQIYYPVYNQKLIERVYSASASFKVLSAYPWERSLVGTSNLVDDIVLLQVRNTDDNATNFAVWFPTSNEAYFLPNGIVPATGGRAASFVMRNRDAPLDYPLTPFQTAYGRADFAYMGLGLSSHKGGVLIANAEGLFVFNYVAPGQDANFPSGCIYLRQSGLPFPDESAIVKTVQPAGLLVGRFSWKFTYYSSRLGLRSPVSNRTGYYDMSTVGAVDEVQTVTMTATGGTWTLRFNGEPTAALARNISTANLQTALEGLTTIGAGNVSVSGVAGASYVIHFIGTKGGVDWDMIQLGTALLTGGTATIVETAKGAPGQKIDFAITVPATPLFDNTFPGGRLIDKFEVWRKREVAVGGGAFDDTWYRVSVVDIPANGVVTYTDNTLDEAREFVRAPVYGYAPTNAQFVEAHQNRSWILPLTPGEVRLFNSDAPNNVTGELGHEYFPPYANAVLDDNTPSDHHAVTLRSEGDFLIAQTNHNAFILNTVDVELGEISARRLEGKGGASQWVVLRTADGQIIIPSRLGELFRFTGSDLIPISPVIPNLCGQLTQKTWMRTSAPEPGEDSWYFASAALMETPGNKMAIISTFLDQGLAQDPAVQLVYHFDADCWTHWDLQGWSFLQLREWSGNTGKGKPIVCFSDSQGNLVKLQRGKADRGVAFTWQLLFPRLHFGDALLIKMVRNAHFLFGITNYGGANAAATFGYALNGGAFNDKAYTLTNTEEILRRLDARCRDIQFRLTGTIADDQKQAELTACATLFQPVGPRR